ncbi:unnamed protein product [Victoria cruziana]
MGNREEDDRMEAQGESGSESPGILADDRRGWGFRGISHRDHDLRLAWEIPGISAPAARGSPGIWAPVELGARAGAGLVLLGGGRACVHPQPPTGSGHLNIDDCFGSEETRGELRWHGDRGEKKPLIRCVVGSDAVGDWYL